MRHLFLLIVILFSHPLLALSCVRPDIDAQISDAERIYIAEIVSIDASKNISTDSPWDAELEVISTVNVIESLKGNSQGLIQVRFSFKPTLAQRFVIFDDDVFSSACDISPSRREAQASALIEKIKSQ